MAQGLSTDEGARSGAWLQIGGQALMEGVCVRTPARWALAVRRKDGSIYTEAHPVPDRWPRLRRTFLRGIVALVDAVTIGPRANAIAVREATGSAVEGLGIVLVPVVVGLVAVFIVGPALVTSRWTGVVGDALEAAVRAAMLLIFLYTFSRSETERRLFAYHGAEHMAIAAYERHRRIPALEDARAENPVHVRCGTDFIALFVITCGVVFSFIARAPIWLAAVVRVALLPVVLMLAYEVMRAAASHHGTWWSRAITAPGRALQRITTRQPSDDMLEVALSALRAAVAVGDTR